MHRLPVPRRLATPEVDRRLPDPGDACLLGQPEVLDDLRRRPLPRSRSIPPLIAGEIGHGRYQRRARLSYSGNQGSGIGAPHRTRVHGQIVESSLLPKKPDRTEFGPEGSFAYLDAIDRNILAVLQQNARLSNKELASRIRLSQSSCLARVRRLEERGVIVGYHARIDLARLGRPLQALVAIRYRHTEGNEVERFTREVVALPETRSLFHVTGDDDFLLHVAVADTNQLRGFVLDRLVRRPEVERVRTSIIFEHRQPPGANGV